MSTVTVALEALTKDSGRWQETSTVLGTASSSCAALTLTDTQLSWASQDTGLQATYDELRAKVETLLREGSDETGKISRTLAHVRQVYESSDTQAIAQLHGVWDVK